MNKAVLINSLKGGGAERIVTTIVSELSEKNEKIKLICLEKNIFFKTKIKIDYLSNYKGEENKLEKAVAIVKMTLRLKRYIKENNICTVQSHLYRANFINILAAIIGSKHNVQIVNHGNICNWTGKGIIGNLKKIILKLLYSKADSIIAISNGMANDIKKLTKNKIKVKVVYNPFNIGKIRKKEKEAIDSKEFIYKKDRKYLISVGRIIKSKRNEDLIKAFQKVKEKKDDIELIFLGEGREKSELEKIVKENKIDKYVHFLGLVENPYKFISRANILVLPSESEGFGNVIVEAMVCGTPVIAADCPYGPREILAPETRRTGKKRDCVEQTEYGILYPVGNIECLAQAILLLLEDSKKAFYYRKAGKERAEAFRSEKSIQQYLAVLNGKTDCNE